MGSRGPIPNPKSGRSQTGRNTRTAKQPISKASAVPMPAHLESVAAAAALWEQLAAVLIADGRLVPERAEPFALLCRLHADIRQLEDQVAAEGWISATERGQAASPVAKLLRDARRDFVALAREFGLTAAAAARIPQEPTDGEEKDDPEAALLAKLSVRG